MHHHAGMASAAILGGPRIGASGHPLTREQERIISIPPTRTLKWQAFAGCAKTTTSVEYTSAHPETALYLAFNAPIAADAKGRFPNNVETYTAHGYAYQEMGVRNHSDRLIKTRLRPEHLDPCAGQMRPIARMSELAVRRAVLKSLNRFLISGDQAVSEKHLVGFPLSVRPACVSMVSAVVERLMDWRRSDMLFTHDIYLKSFARERTISDRFDYVIVDEAQDLNPVLIDIVQKARRPAMIVGDPWQSIYLFRGAESAMEQFDGQLLTLSQSFRFGPEVAAVANYVLKKSLTPPDVPVVGSPNKTTKVREYQGSVKGRATILARTNFRLFESLVQIPHPFHVVGGVDDLISQVAAGYALWKGMTKGVIDPLVVRYKTWDDLKDAAEGEEDPELGRLVKIVDTYGDRIPDVLKDLKSRNRLREDEARFIVSTAHKAKGREWDHVVVLDDFVTPMELGAWLAKKRIKPHEYDQEINLLYVTLTRAIETLSISPNLYDEIAAGTGLPRI